jgi:hypothetical protein
MLQTENREILRSNMMNAALFYPGGFLLAALLPKEYHIFVTVLILLLFSISIKLIQHALLLDRGSLMMYFITHWVHYSEADRFFCVIFLKSE